MSNSEKPIQGEHDSAPFAMRRSITLQVGERRFITTAETMTQESAFFAALFSGRRDNAEADGSYFIDADPDLFEHILRYLRRGCFLSFMIMGRATITLYISHFWKRRNIFRFHG